MPFKSEAQRKKFKALEAEGKLPLGTTAKWEEETKKQGLKKLPEYARPKKIKIKEI
jgi:hypothetical protein